RDRQGPRRRRGAHRVDRRRGRGARRARPSPALPPRRPGGGGVSASGDRRESRQAAAVPDDLLAEAKRAFANAYAPYSRFPVGAALRADDGTVYAGANVENASFGLTRCAEQSAVQAMVTAGRRRFTQVVVYTEADEP